MIFLPVARNFLFDLAILAFSIFKPVALHFRVDLAIFAPTAHYSCIDLAIFVAGARIFFYLTNFEPVPCLSHTNLSIFVPVGYHFFQDPPSFALTAGFLR